MMTRPIIQEIGAHSNTNAHLSRCIICFAKAWLLFGQVYLSVEIYSANDMLVNIQLRQGE